jgi:putative endonuclease
LGNWRWRRFCLEHHRFNTTIIQDGAMREYHFHILQSVSRRALYIGVTNNLRHRVFQHKNHPFEGFTDDYNAIRVVYWEHFDSVGKLAKSSRNVGAERKKTWLVERMNPGWKDPAVDWYETQGLSTAVPVRPTDAHLRSR